MWPVAPGWGAAADTLANTRQDRVEENVARGHVTPCGLARERMSAATITGREFARQRGLADIVGARRGLVLMARGPRRDRCGKIASLRGKSLSALWKPSCIAETMVRKPTPDPGNAV